MSMLPDIERELLRVARLPLPDEAGVGSALPGRDRARVSGRKLSTAALVASALLALAVAAVFVSALHTSGGGRPSGGAHPASGSFPGAPHTQRNGFGVETGVCPLAAPNRYLPPRSGCVTARRADVTGSPSPDLVLVFSRLSDQRASRLGFQGSLSRDYAATAAMLRVVRAAGGSVTARIPGAHAAAPVAIAHVNNDPGDELFIQVSQISSGATAVAYGFQGGRLVPAGVTLSYGGDSATKAGFDCLGGSPARLVERTFELIGPTIYAWWRETDVTYAWHGRRLVRVSTHTFRRHGLPPARLTGIGAGCAAGIG